jgi:hypothetical protein
MDKNLVGYLLNALDAETQREVEDHLRDSAPAQQRLEQLRRALEPLAADNEPPEPPPGLWLRTLAFVAEDRCRRLPPAPQPVTVLAGGPPSRSWWRRSDVLIAASLLLLAALISIPWIGQLRHRHQIEACKDNLRRFHTALVSYSDLHQGEFPRVEEQPPRNVAGIFVPVLNDHHLLPAELSVACPGVGKHEPTARSVKDLEDLHRTRAEEYNRAAQSLSGCYAYSLGYVNTDGNGRKQLCGLRRDSGDYLPIMADRPPFAPGAVVGVPGNSPNHGGEGQNVLHIDGHVRYLTDRVLPGATPNDDIYLNHRNRIAAGEGPDDTVLGSSWANPSPPE